jgi:VanZ family protein
LEQTGTKKSMVWLEAIFSREASGRLTLFLILAMAVACLWPFWAPMNTASWMASSDGVAFGKHGILVSSGPLRPGDMADSGCTLDLWVEPAQADAKGAILAAFSPANPRLLRVEQFSDGLAIRSAAPGDPIRTGGAQLYADRIFVPGKAVLLTITSNSWGTKAFINGNLRRAVPNFRICHALVDGRLVAGTAADSDYGWRGQLTGIAIFSHVLSPEEIQRDSNTWAYHPGPALGNREGLIALYLFNEGRGNRVRDKVAGANSFYMPDRYLIVAKRFLSAPSFDNHTDMLANIIGFMPLGFTLCAYLLSSRWGKGTSIIATVLLCGLFSLVIEILQWFLPTRDSDMTDVIMNIVGAAGGALLCRLSRVCLAVSLRERIR